LPRREISAPERRERGIMIGIYAMGVAIAMAYKI
jgi:hypothetical protein